MVPPSILRCNIIVIITPCVRRNVSFYATSLFFEGGLYRVVNGCDGDRQMLSAGGSNYADPPFRIVQSFLASTSGKSSRISSRMTPLPAITCGSSKAWINGASTPG